MNLKFILIAFALGGIAGGGGTLYITKAVKPEIKLECPQPICPECPATLGNEFAKIKSKNVTVQVNQKYIMAVNNDSLLIEKISQAMRDELQSQLAKQRIAKCK